MAEIERKFIVKDKPKGLEGYRSVDVEQFYIALSPEVRARRAGGQCFLTVKAGSGMTREETEVELSNDSYDALKRTALGKPIVKTRYFIDLDCGLVIELDVYKEGLEGLCVAEIEFPSELEANMFMALSWFGTEVTYDKSYKNQSLALSGVPKER